MLGDHSQDVYGSRAQFHEAIREAVSNDEDCLVVCMDTADAFRTVTPKDIRRDKQLDAYVRCLVLLLV